MNPQTIALAVVAALLFGAGWTAEGWRKDAEIKALQTEHSQAQERDAKAAAHVLKTALQRGDDLQKRLAESENTRDQLALEKEDVVRRLTVGRRCLDSAAARVLNTRANLKPGQPETTGQLVSADAAFATDTDVGIWIGQCQRSYDTCRGRLQAIADFFETSPDGE